MSNLVMVDFAVSDRRSVKAMLGGRGDGREKAWNKFERLHGAQLDQESLQAAFRKAAANRDQSKMRAALGKVKKVLFVAAAVALVAT
jgi:hypothetical protein